MEYTMFFRKRQLSPAVETVLEEDFPVQSADADNSVFLQSLEDLTPDDIAPAEPVRGSDLLYRAVRALLILICLVVFVYCVWTAVDIQLQSHASDDFYSDLAAQIFADEGKLPGSGITRMSMPLGARELPVFADALNAEPSQISPGVTVNQSYNLEFERMRAMLNDLAAQNPDIYGFIRVEGTNIAYPIMQSDDNEHYLHYQSNGMPSVSGSIFADVRCSRVLMENVNVILYGH
ncbi:MAG: class B sortase, partial [Clostridia bacterium]|nr:class B sortase [Clostridia bacterium]